MTRNCYNRLKGKIKLIINLYNNLQDLSEPLKDLNEEIKLLTKELEEQKKVI